MKSFVTLRPRFTVESHSSQITMTALWDWISFEYPEHMLCLFVLILYVQVNNFSVISR